MHRTLERCRSISLRLVVVAAVIGLPTLAAADILTVTTAADVVDSGDGVLSLREALDEALPGDTIAFGPGLSGQTILLTLGTLNIGTDLTISGPGAAALTIDGNAAGRVIYVESGASVVLSGLTITGGSHGGGGGGVRHDGLDMQIIDCHITGNASGWAGAAVAHYFGFTMTVSGTLIDNNAGGIGAGLFINAGTVVVTDSTIRNNIGGGIWNLAGDLTVTGSTVSGNVVHSNDGGGGVLTTSGTSVLVNSTVSGNTLTGLFGGFGSGGGLKVNFGTVRLFSSTVVGNSAFIDGGGLAASLSPGAIELVDTIVAGNTAPVGDDCVETGGTIASLGFNVVGGLSGCPSDGPGDQVIDSSTVFTALLGPLSDNGGPTETHDLVAGSAALDMGDPSGCKDAGGAVLAFDQRGVGRPIGVACDVGAVESDGSLVPPLGGAADGLSVFRVTCRNLETAQEVVLPGQSSWDCAAAGLSTSRGDRVLQLVEGKPSAASWGGSTVGIDDSRIRVVCSNLSTGQSVDLLLVDESSYDCQDAGLNAAGGDRLRFATLGDAQ